MVVNIRILAKDLEMLMRYAKLGAAMKGCADAWGGSVELSLAQQRVNAICDCLEDERSDAVREAEHFAKLLEEVSDPALLSMVDNRKR